MIRMLLSNQNGKMSKRTGIMDLFPELFDGIGCVNTLYRIELTADAQPVKHAARRVPESVRPKVKHELDRLVQKTSLNQWNVQQIG